MNVLVVGSGGREHAIVRVLRQSPKVTRLFSAPGNAGIGEDAELVPITTDDIQGLADFAHTHKIGLTIVGNETPLVKGIVDLFEDRGLTIFGPSKEAAQLEGSKIFLKDFLKRHAIPTAYYQTFNQSDISEANAYIQHYNPPFVIKTDGLAAGKGVAICATPEEARNTLREYFETKIFGDAGKNIVIEEFMEGEEASVFAMCDGGDYVLLSPAQDHKRIGDADTGKNTGGMGAYAPAPIVTNEILEAVERQIIQPTLRGMKDEGRPYKGCLYVGLMITRSGPKVVEFNVRLGDPESQVVLPLIDSDVFDLFYSCATGTVNRYTLKLKNSSAVVVVAASQGYPDEYQTGKIISGLDAAAGDAVIFHAGTKKENGAYVSSGGRVLGITAIAHSLNAAVSKAYAAAGKISFDNAYYRTDIGQKGLRRLQP